MFCWSLCMLHSKCSVHSFACKYPDFPHFSREDIQMTNRYMQRCLAAGIFQSIGNGNWNHNDISFQTIRNAIIKKQDKCGEKLEHFYTADRNVKWCTTMGKTMKAPQTIKNRTIINPAMLLLDIYPKRLKYGSPRVISSPLLTLSLFTIVNIWKHFKYLSTDEWIKKV